MPLCLTVECIASGLEFLLRCLFVFLSIQSTQLMRPQPHPIPGVSLE